MFAHLLEFGKGHITEFGLQNKNRNPIKLVIRLILYSCKEIKQYIFKTIVVHVKYCSCPTQEVTKGFRLSWLTNSALVCEPKCGGYKVGGSCGVSANEYNCKQDSKQTLEI
jgi:hypothetical protein